MPCTSSAFPPLPQVDPSDVVSITSLHKAMGVSLEPLSPRAPSPSLADTPSPGASSSAVTEGEGGSVEITESDTSLL